MKLYIAGPFAARDLLAQQAWVFEQSGHTITSEWLYGTRPITLGTVGTSPDSSDKEVRQHANADLEQVSKADVLIMYTEQWIRMAKPDITGPLNSGGRHVEMGYALALGKPVVVMGPTENIFQRGLALTATSTTLLAAALREEDSQAGLW